MSPQKIMENLTQTEVAQEAAMDALYESTLAQFTEGSIIKGTIIRVQNNDVIIDIGYKSEGAVSTSEFAELSENPVGEEVEVFLECLEDDHGGIVI